MIQKVTTFFKWWKDWPPTFWVNLTRRSTRGKLGSVVITILEISVTPFSRTTVIPSFDYIHWASALNERDLIPQPFKKVAFSSKLGRKSWNNDIIFSSFFQPKNNPTAPKKIPLETGKTEEPFTAGFPGFPPLRYITLHFQEIFFWRGPHLLLARCSGDVIFFGGFPLHLRTVVSFTTKKWPTVKRGNSRMWKADLLRVEVVAGLTSI